MSKTSALTAAVRSCSYLFVLAAPIDFAMAQSAQSSAAGDIVVTAQKREQSINDVGLTIQAASAETLSERGITSVADLAKLVPGFTATQSTFATPVYTLRGIGLYDATIGAAPAVAVYTDQVPRNFPTMSDALELDIERVEVLKGPQGTLFGQSATGGAINYIVGKPTNEFEAGIDTSYERFGKADIAGFVSGPISDTLKARAAVRAINGGAWQYSVSRPGDENGDTRKIMGRLSLDWTPTEQLQIQTTLTGARDRSDTQAPQHVGSLFNIYSATALAAANANPLTANPYGYVDEDLYAAYTTPGAPAYDASFLAKQATAVARLNGVDPLSGVVPGLQAGTNALLGPEVGTNNRAADWSQGFLRRSDNSYYQGTVRADYDLTDSITLTSITAYAKSEIDHTIDLDGTTADSLNIPSFGSIKAFNQELRLSGKTEKLNWIIGGNYDDAKTSDNNFYQLYHYIGNNPLGATSQASSVSLTLNNFDTQLKTTAVFANAEYAITDNLNFNGGIRYTKFKESASYCYNDPASDVSQGSSAVFTIFQGLFNPGVPGLQPILAGECFPFGDGLNGTTLFQPTRTPLDVKQNEDNISWRAGVDYKLETGGLLYATVSQGYKAGVFSNIGASTTSQYTPAKQEKVLAYEAGVKFPTMDGRLQVNAAAFYYDYTDKQIRAKVLDPVWSLLEKLINVPKSKVWGFEADITARPIDGLTLSASGTYLNSEVSKSFSALNGQAIYNGMGFTGDLKGSDLPFTPEFSANADIQYQWTIGETLQPFVGGTVVYQGKQNGTFKNSILRADIYEIPDYTTLDLRAGIGSQDGKWQLSAFGRNVTNETIVTAPTFYHDAYFRLTGKPAIYGINFKVRM